MYKGLADMFAICNKFSFKLIMDLGYDMTMMSKHRCGQQIGCFEMSIPQTLRDVNEWTATIISGQLSYYSSIGKMLRADGCLNILRRFRTRTSVKIWWTDILSLTSLEATIRIGYLVRLQTWEIKY